MVLTRLCVTGAQNDVWKRNGLIALGFMAQIVAWGVVYSGVAKDRAKGVESQSIKCGLVCLGLLLFWTSFYHGILAAFKDPGILSWEKNKIDGGVKALEENSRQIEIVDKGQKNNESSVDIMNEEAKPSAADVFHDASQKTSQETSFSEQPSGRVQSGIFKHRYCRTCKLMRPPGASHCRHCGNCVKAFDQ